MAGEVLGAPSIHACREGGSPRAVRGDADQRAAGVRDDIDERRVAHWQERLKVLDSVIEIVAAAMTATARPIGASEIDDVLRAAAMRRAARTAPG